MLPTVGIFYINSATISRLSTAIKYACVESSRASDDKYLPSTGEWRKKGRIREKTASCVYNIRKEEFATSSQTRDKKKRHVLARRTARGASRRDKMAGGREGEREKNSDSRREHARYGCRLYQTWPPRA